MAWADEKLKKMEQTMINIRIFIETEICVRESEVTATGSERGSSADLLYENNTRLTSDRF